MDAGGHVSVLNAIHPFREGNGRVMSKLVDEPVKRIGTRFGAIFEANIVLDIRQRQLYGCPSTSLAALKRRNAIRDRDPAGDGARDSPVTRATSVGIEGIALTPTGRGFHDDLRTPGIDASRVALEARLHPKNAYRFAAMRDRSSGNGVEERPILVSSVRHLIPPAGEPHTRPS